MSKPTSFDDLDYHQKQGPLAFTINTETVLRMPHKVAAALLALADAVDGAVGLIPEEGPGWRTDSGVTFRCTLTDEEKEQRLTRAQERWDLMAEMYEKAARSEKAGYVSKYAVDQWAKDEGREPIDWSYLVDEEKNA